MRSITLHDIETNNISGGIAVANEAQYDAVVELLRSDGYTFEDDIPEYDGAILNVGRIEGTTTLMTNFKECEYTFQPYLTAKECMELLLAGKTLIRPGSGTRNKLDAQGNLAHSLDGNWLPAKEWYEEIPPEGIFCFVSSGEPITEAYFALIEEYDPEKDCPFKASVVSWKLARPVSREWALARVWRES